MAKSGNPVCCSPCPLPVAGDPGTGSWAGLSSVLPPKTEGFISKPSSDTMQVHWCPRADNVSVTQGRKIWMGLEVLLEWKHPLLHVCTPTRRGALFNLLPLQPLIALLGKW